MANIKPFRGIRYDQARIDSISNVISQPYDRIRYGLQEQYYALSDYNIARIIKGVEYDSDTETENVYTRARAYLDRWLAEGILVREDQPAYYVYHQTFPLPSGESITRKAFISAIELSGFDKGIVLPHEKTHAGPKVDRLKLTRATEAYFGTIFMLYPDQDNQIDGIFDRAINRPPDIEARELHENDVLHQVWVVTDPDVLKQVTDTMAPKTKLIIADGHHRYETALTYQAEQNQAHPEAPDDAGFNYCMVALVSQSNPGLTILPTHRLIFDFPGTSSQEVLEKARDYFEITELPDRIALENKLIEAENQIGWIGFVHQDGFYLLKLNQPQIMKDLAPDRVQAWRDLDVSILHQLLLEKILGVDPSAIDNLENINYLREPDLGYD